MIRTAVAALLVVLTMSVAGRTFAQDAPVRIGYLPIVSSLTHFVAVERGYYSSEGLTVAAGPVATSNLLAQQVAAGQIDVAVELSIVPLLRLLETAPQAAKIFSISSITTDNGFDAVVVVDASPAKDLCALAGKTVGMFPGTTARRTFAAVYETKCPGRAAPTLRELDPGLHVPSLIRGDIDALHAYEPTLSLAMARGGLRRLFPSVYATQLTPNPIGVAAVSGDFARTRDAIASKVIRALDSAVVFIRRNPAQARAILAKATRVDSSVAAVMNLMPMSLHTETRHASLQPYLDLLASMQETSRRHVAAEILLTAANRP